MFKYCLIDTRQCLSNQWIILTGLTYIISSIPDVIFFSSYRGSIADFIILSFSNQYYFLLIILPLLFLFLLKSYYSFLKYCYAYTQILLSAELLLQACRSLF